MKFYFALTALLSAIGWASADQWLPLCAQACVATTPVRCQPTDFSCACNTKKYIKALMYCIVSDCSAEDQRHAIDYLDDLCHADWQPKQESWFAPHWGLELRQTRSNSSSTTTGGGSSGTSGRPRPNDGLSTGAKAGIGVGVTLGVLLLGGIVGFIFYKKRGQAHAAAAAAGGTITGGLPPSEKPGGPIGPQEIDGTQKPWTGSELPNTPAPPKPYGAELPAPGGPVPYSPVGAELPGHGVPAAFPPAPGTHEMPVNQQNVQWGKPGAPPAPAQGEVPAGKTAQEKPPTAPAQTYQGPDPNEMPAGVPGWYGGPQSSDPPSK